MAQDSGREDEQSEVDASPEFDMVTLFSSSNTDAELEATNIRNLLESNGIPALVVGASVIPSLAFQVQVPQARLEEAQRLVAEAQAAGPEAAAEAEAASEE